MSSNRAKLTARKAAAKFQTKPKYHIVFAVLLHFIFFTQSTNGLKCYSCNYREINSANPNNDDCLWPPAPVAGTVPNLDMDCGTKSGEFSLCYKGNGFTQLYGATMDRGCIHLRDPDTPGKCRNLTEVDSRPTLPSQRRTISKSAQVVEQKEIPAPFKDLFNTLFSKEYSTANSNSSARAIQPRFIVPEYRLCFCNTDFCNEEGGYIPIDPGSSFKFPNSTSAAVSNFYVSPRNLLAFRSILQIGILLKGFTLL